MGRPLVGAPLSILVVGGKWPPETFLARLFRGLLDQGVRLTVAGPDRPEQTWFRHPAFEWLFTPAWAGAARGSTTTSWAAGCSEGWEHRGIYTAENNFARFRLSDINMPSRIDSVLYQSIINASHDAVGSSIAASR